MPRSRNIKYEFFTNDELADNDPLGRLLFIGLWTLADYKGDLIWKERRIKAKLLPYDDCDVNKLAINLDKSGFIRFYSDGVNLYARVVNFDSHQNPHKNEKDKGSDIPEYCEQMRQAVDLITLTINRDKNRLNPEHSASDPADSLSLIPDSLSLIPDSANQDPPMKNNSSAIADDEEYLFELFWNSGIKKVNKKKTKPIFIKLVRQKKDKNEFVEFLINDVLERLKLGQMGFAEMHPTTYLNGERYNDDYPKEHKHNNQERLSTVEQSLRVGAEYKHRLEVEREARRRDDQSLGYANG